MQEHAVGRDVLLVAPKGEGKSVLAEHFCQKLGYQAHLFPLYKEMTAPDLLLRRTSSSEWTESPLLAAARTGQVCILDGVEKLSRGTLATLQGFLTDREVELPDGTQLRCPESPSEHIDDGTAIHPSFRVVALASVSSSGSGRSAPPTWLSEEAISMLSTIVLPAPSRECLRDILRPHNAYSDAELEQILDFHERLLESVEECGVAAIGSTRQRQRRQHPPRQHWLVPVGQAAPADAARDARVAPTIVRHSRLQEARAETEAARRTSGGIGRERGRQQTDDWRLYDGALPLRTLNNR